VIAAALRHGRRSEGRGTGDVGPLAPEGGQTPRCNRFCLGKARQRRCRAGIDRRAGGQQLVLETAFIRFPADQPAGFGCRQGQIEGGCGRPQAEAAAELAGSIGSPAIIAFTSSGTTAARIARRRAPTPILAITPDLATLRRLTLYWGVEGVLSDDIATYEDMVQRASELALAEGYVASGDTMVVVAGVPFAQRGTTNNLRVVHVGR